MKNRTERRIIAAFEDKNATISPTFKKQLRRQMLAKQTRMSRTPISPLRKVFLVATPVAIALVLVSAATFFEASPVVAPHKVSAQEVLDKAIKAYDTFDTSKYNYSLFTLEQSVGPRYTLCFGKPGGADYTKSTSRTYAYRNEKLDLYHTFYWSAYDTGEPFMYSEKGEAAKANDAFRGRSLKETISMIGAGGRKFVNKNGVAINGQKATPQTVSVDGREAYELFIYDAKDYGGCPGAPDKSTGAIRPGYDTISRFLIDTQTYSLVRIESYVAAVTPKNLISTETMSVTYETLSPEAALQKMTAAGFDVKNAKDTMQGGDGHSLWL